MQRTTLKLQAFALIAFSAASSSAAFAENCKALPFGPEKKACVMREHPDMFEAKQERCRQLCERARRYSANGYRRGRHERIRSGLYARQTTIIGRRRHWPPRRPWVRVWIGSVVCRASSNSRFRKVELETKSLDGSGTFSPRIICQLVGVKSGRTADVRLT